MRLRIAFPLLGLLAAVSMAAPAAAVTHTINQVSLSFSPANITVQVGDTVEWIRATGIHTVTSGNGALDPEVGVLFDAPLNSADPSFSFTFTEVGAVPYFCRPHETFGMAGTITVEAATTTHTINQIGTTFSPANITIQVGDRVNWVWSFGVHTVTNGNNEFDPNAGLIFDQSLTSTSPSFVFTFTEVGVQPFFCRPHEFLGMKGTITVEAVSGVEDVPAEAGHALLQNVPNPFNPQTKISFVLAEDATVNLEVHDLAGRLVRTLLAGQTVGEGRHEAVWDGRDDAGQRAAAGVYLYMLEAGRQRETRSMVLVK